jgi:hypothetical protein
MDKIEDRWWGYFLLPSVRQKFNDIVDWINAHEARESAARELLDAGVIQDLCSSVPAPARLAAGRS